LSGTQHLTQPDSAAEINAAERKSARMNSLELPAPSARTHSPFSANCRTRIEEIWKFRFGLRGFLKAAQVAASFQAK
jgi:hypothetical protein